MQGAYGAPTGAVGGAADGLGTRIARAPTLDEALLQLRLRNKRTQYTLAGAPIASARRGGAREPRWSPRKAPDCALSVLGAFGPT